MKKLEPGMLCRVVSSLVPENNGRVVTLVEFLGVPNCSSGSPSGKWTGKDWWAVDAGMTTSNGHLFPFMRACRLQPINPDHQPADEEWQADFKRLISVTEDHPCHT